MPWLVPRAEKFPHSQKFPPGLRILGQVGVKGLFHYMAIGSVANLAARLCDAAEAGQILIGQRVHAEVEDLAQVEAVGEFELKGFSKPMPILNLLVLKEGVS